MKGDGMERKEQGRKRDIQFTFLAALLSEIDQIHGAQ